MRRRLEPNSESVSTIFRTPSGTLLLLGSLQNALAAADNSIPDVDVSHIFSCGSARSATLVQRRLEMSGRTDAVSFHKCLMQDRFREDEEFNLSRRLGFDINAILAALDMPPSSLPSRAVIVHCDMGVNRSPTLAMAAMVSMSLSLREVYKLVLQTRCVDPLPTYRRALESLEQRVSGRSTVSRPRDIFALHISEILQQYDDDVDGAYKCREVSIAQLVVEVESAHVAGKAATAATYLTSAMNFISTMSL